MKYWKRLNPNNSIITVESYSHNLDIEGATEITKQEFNGYISSLPVPNPEPTRDLGAEIDALEARVDILETEQGL